ncbi:transglycosylase SLT domain-containing protein [Actinophytocola oryzae]|uniref:Transglycosylase-like protein with SLT domain n=1 Tax=Actinophytocola oryzae TaxID=502181 RepID=A0A4R7W0E3_9PSEU|nr:transglycosylase SLT domain-containing protein [Actinophytocola oryzae]TDV54997.1 transglycosylase-like protein with SLT domain [Actinophytocola oryzae]
MPVLSDQEIARHAANAGWSGNDLETAVAVALAESGGDPDLLGDVRLQTDTWGPSVGLWQIRSINAGHGNQFDQQHRNEAANHDPATNAANAHAIYEQAGGWRPWTVHRTGAYQQYLDRARRAVEANRQAPAPTEPASGQQSGAAGGGNGMSAQLSELFGALPKLLQSGDRLGKVGQAAQQTAARSGAFGEVPGSSTAQQANQRNAQRHSAHANQARGRIDRIGQDVDSSGRQYERQDLDKSQEQQGQRIQIDNAYDAYQNYA